MASSKISFNIGSDKFTQHEEDIILQGQSKITANGNLQLTDPDNNGVGRALYANPLILWDSETGKVVNFETKFTFSVSKYKDFTEADGIAFFLAPVNSNGTPNPIPTNSNGGQLGLVNASNAYNRFVAVEFDTFTNSWDPKIGPHIAIDVNSIISLKVTKWQLEDAFRYTVTISYDSESQTLSVSVNNPDGTTSAVEQDIDLKTTFPDGLVNFGFSAAQSQGGHELNYVYSWYFSSYF